VGDQFRHEIPRSAARECALIEASTTSAGSVDDGKISFLRVIAVIASWLGLAVTAWAIVRQGTSWRTSIESPAIDTRRLFMLIAAAWALFAVAAWRVRRLPVWRAVVLVIAGSIGLQIIAFSAPPRTSDDLYRYVWDGRVQAAGINPYRYSPADPELAHVRDPWLWPSAQQCAQWRRPPGCTLINRPNVPTIYPPGAQTYFLALHYASPPESRHKPPQIGAAILAVATTIGLVFLLNRLKRDPRLAVWWAWCPMVFLEAGNNGHIDVLGALLLVAALGAFALRRRVLSATLLGAASAVKLLPALALPAMLRRRPWAIAGSAGAVFALSYLPHVLSVGPAVLGYLPGYLAEEGYTEARRFAVLRLLVPDRLTVYAGIGLLVGTALVVLRRGDPARPWRGALVMTGITLAVAGPSYPWYGLLVVALVALDGRWEWLAVAAAGYPPYFAPNLGFDPLLTQQWSYGSALALVGTVSYCRWRATRSQRSTIVAANSATVREEGKPLPHV